MIDALLGLSLGVLAACAHHRLLKFRVRRALDGRALESLLLLPMGLLLGAGCMGLALWYSRTTFYAACASWPLTHTLLVLRATRRFDPETFPKSHSLQEGSTRHVP